MEIKAFGPFKLEDLVGRDRQETSARPVHDAQIMELLQTFDRYRNGCPFKPGDIVAPLTSSGQRYAGEPHIVLEVPETPHQTFAIGDDTSDVSNSSYGCRLDMRVAVVANSNGENPILPFWVESWQFLPYSPAG